MLIVKEIAPGQFQEIAYGSSFTGSGGSLHGWQCTELWSDSQLAQVGVYRVDLAAPPSDPEVIVNGYHFERIAGRVMQVIDLSQPAPQTKQQLKDYAATKRYDAEVGGMTSEVFGRLFTDRDTRSIIGQTIQSIDLGIVAEPVNFKTASGFIALSRADFVAIATALANHVQSTFDREDAVDASIEAETVTTKAQIDAAFQQ